MKIREGDWAGWVIVILFLLIIIGILLLLLAGGGCTAVRSIVGISPIPDGQIVIPSSPATQMWKVVAKSNWVVTICLLGFGGGLFTFFNGKPKLGLAIVFSCAGTLFFGLAIHRFPTWMAIVGLLGSVAGVVASILMKHRAIIEIIKGGQAFKKTHGEGLTPLRDIFTMKQKQEQSPATQKLVKKIKGNLKLKGEM